MEGSCREARLQSHKQEAAIDKGKSKKQVSEQDHLWEEPQAEAVWRQLIQAGHHVSSETEFL